MDSARPSGTGRPDSGPCHSRENGNPGGRTKDHVTPDKDRKRTITNLSFAAPRQGAAVQRACIRDRLPLYAGCTFDRTPPADATGLDSRGRGHDIGGSGSVTNYLAQSF